MASDKNSNTSAKKSTPADKSISIGGDVVDSVVIVGDNNKTFFQKVINIFKSDTETLEHRNRRILLGHVENAWIKGVLDASLHGAALLDLGIKEDPEAVTKYPWAIKKESTDETLPSWTSMLEIFDSIGMGRSLLILGAPGSGKTTMLLELARQLIQRAREDVIAPIPMVFNLASWTEKLTLADWLAQELNNLYSVPRKTAPDWVKGNKLLLLLDGLDEVRLESRAKCVEAINAFRKEHGLTSLAVCSRSQDYADLNAKLSFEGAIEVQPLTQKQITEFFNRFGKEMAGIKQVLKKDSALREMAETPLFLSIMIMAYRDKKDLNILASQDMNTQRKHIFDNYIGSMFERPHSTNTLFKRQNAMHWLSWLASKMVEHNQIPYLLENTQPSWLGKKRQWSYRLSSGLIIGLIFGLIGGVEGKLFAGLAEGLIIMFIYVLLSWFSIGPERDEISTVDFVSWFWSKEKMSLVGLLISVLILGLILVREYRMISLLILATTGLVIGWLTNGLSIRQIDQTTYPGQRLISTAKNFFLIFIAFGSIFGLILGITKTSAWLFGVLLGGLMVGLAFGGFSLIRHYSLRITLARNNLLPWRLVPFLDHCVDLIFLRRVGGGYIFVHRLLMEHFAEMYVEEQNLRRK